MSWLQDTFKFNTLHKTSIVTSSFQACKSQQFFNILLFWRVVSFILTLGTCSINIMHQVHQREKKWNFFLSFTNLNFIFMSCYFMAAAWLSFNDWRKKRNLYFVSVPGGNSTTESLLYGSSVDDDDLAMEQPAPKSHKVFWVMFEIAFTFAMFVDIVFWGAVYTGDHDILIIILHALNGLLMIGELFLNSLVFVASHVVFVWVVLTAYAIEVIVWHAVGNEWAYPFLDPSNKIAYAYYPVLFVAATVTFLIGYLLVKLRDWKKLRDPYSSVNIPQTPVNFVF